MLLRDYQERALADLRTTVGQGIKRVVLQAPCGAGKTKIASAVVQGAIAKGNRLAFVVSSLSLIDQAVEMFASDGITDVGVIQADHQLTDWSKPVQICSIQTILKRGAYPAAQVVVFDECHVLFKAHKEWMLHGDWSKVPFIGLSATPWSKGLGDYFETLLVVTTTSELINQGYLSPFRVFSASHPDLTGVKKVAGDYHEGQLSEAMQRGTLTADIVETWKKRWGKDKTLVFGVDCAHARALQERFAAAGVSAGYQDARTDSAERADIKRKFHSGEYQVVCNVGTLTTGVDWDVRCLSLARPTRSEILYCQIIGRALRTAEGKSEAIILDHSDTTARLGFITEIGHDRMRKSRNGAGVDDESPERKAPLPKECEACTALVPRGTRICPNCGHAFKLASCNIFEADGELHEVKLSHELRQKAKMRREWTAEEKRQFYRELKRYGIDHGYSEKWAYANYLDKFGAKPSFSGFSQSPADYVSGVTMGWIRSKFIKWANSKKERESRAGM